jgi:hypothetical protein
MDVLVGHLAEMYADAGEPVVATTALGTVLWTNRAAVDELQIHPDMEIAPILERPVLVRGDRTWQVGWVSAIVDGKPVMIGTAVDPHGPVLVDPIDLTVPDAAFD